MSVLVATKVKDSTIWLPRFIDQVEQLEGNIKRIVIIYGESKDGSLALLKHWQATSKHRVEIYREPYLNESERSGATLAKLKMDIQALLKAGGEEYYLNLDCDLVNLPTTLIPDLMSRDKDLIAAMVWTEGRKTPAYFDTYEFRKEGCMFHPYHPPGIDLAEPFPVDSVSTCYLAKAEVELAGVYSNPYPHIPFCKTLKDKGYQIWVDPTVYVYHIDLERLGIMHQPLNHPYSMVPFITNFGVKMDGAHVGAERFQNSRSEYENDVSEKAPEIDVRVKEWLNKRPLITASMKVLNESGYIGEALTSIYPYVDKIDILYGPVAASSHITYRDNTPEIIKSFPDKERKITFIEGTWRTKEDIQQQLLEICQSKWMLYLDADEIIDKDSAKAMRKFCMRHQDGKVVYARPKRFINFLHDFQHVAWSQNPLSPWAEFGLPHAFLIWRDIPGLNFAGFHTIPVDGLGVQVNADSLTYSGRQKVLDDVIIYHFGNAKDKTRTLDKIRFERRRDRNNDAAENDWWFTGDMPPEFIVGDWNENDLPAIMKKHMYFGKTKIKVTQTKPNYKFEVLQ
jgi:hypothetical protein